MSQIAYINWEATGTAAFPLIQKAIRETPTLAHLPDLLHINTPNTIPDTLDVSKVEIVIVDASVVGLWSRFPSLKLILSAWAGIDRLLKDPDFPRHIPLIRLVDNSMTKRMGQIALTHVLNHHREMNLITRQQIQKVWNKKPRGVLPPPMEDVQIGILGIGVLGKEVASQLIRNGFTGVRGWGTVERSLTIPRLVDSVTGNETAVVEEVSVQVVAGREGLEHVLRTSDIVISLLPSTPDTYHLIGYSEFSKMKRGSMFVNLGRGATVVQDDVIRALDDEDAMIEWAVLDVFELEPLPESNPLWSHPHVIVTPHMAALTDYTFAARTIANSLRLYTEGAERIPGLVDFSKGF
ncbi:hypothetical protein BCR33DRAFT_717430 [Rhizoclosmatium globosum]|uniref:D-isomer specific 2-hydroxyacid dehydrogenase NAD-binding domain-containing protein n=1 Tax=Rhizoclosmatium globosum TaxID=329046 RepID=A0A1Y2C9S4_9FUNG|nr:hypothetical protein BCR33DRAFT_717430 [Rhizoclosmatium globosum]|eukprot:ORY43788.1 hypothetical protein BCR33DRAFT_717430 [Rhizoclosmatium globosum]